MLDPVLPTYEMREYHDIAVAATPEAAIAAALALPAATDPIVTTLFWLRGIPGGELPFKEFFSRLGLKPVVSTERAFVGVGDLGGVRIAFGMWAEARGDNGARLATETRVHALSSSPMALPALLARRRSPLGAHPAALACGGASRRGKTAVIRRRRCARASSPRSRRAVRR